MVLDFGTVFLVVRAVVIGVTAFVAWWVID